MLSVGCQHGAQVCAGEHVTVEDHGRVMAQERLHVADAAAGAQGLFFHDVVDFQAELGAVAEVLLKHFCLVGGAHDHVLDSCCLDAGQQVRQERVARRGQHRLWGVHRQGAQAGALAANQNNGVNL